MSKNILKKIRTGRRIFKEKGITGVFNLLVYERFGFQLARARNWLTDNNWYVGRGIELLGDRVRIDGYRFSVKSIAVATGRKSRFLFNGRNYEPSEREALKTYLNTDMPVIELGGSIGVLSCLTNKELRDSSKHIVVEANPDLISLLETNRDQNQCRFEIINAAVAYGTETVVFYQNSDFVSSSVQLVASKSVVVPAITLNEVVKNSGFSTFTLICDIEGAEKDLVEFDYEVLRDRVGHLIIEIHESILGRETYLSIIERLELLGFEQLSADWETHVFVNRRNARSKFQPAHFKSRAA